MQIFKQHRAFFVLYFTFLLLGGYLLIVYSKTSIHLYFNQYNNLSLDYFFKYLTHLGDGLSIVIVGLLFLVFKSRRAGLQIWVSGILGGVLSQFMKHIVFGSSPRPAKYFTEIDPYVLHYVDGVEMNYVNSLPSGHTTAAFAMCLSIAFIYKNRQMDTAMFVLAFLISISRIYLSQHFFEDIYLGSMVGVLSAIIAYSWLYSPKYMEKTKLSKPLYKYAKA
jgi:membrane-associated phospholipid phosphatase